MKHALPPALLRSFVATCLALALIATPALAQDAASSVLPKIADQWGCPSQGHFHFCSRDNATTVRMQCPYGCNFAVIGDDSFEDAADGYIYVPRDLMARTKGLREY